MPGPPPKPPSRRQRRNTPSLDIVVAVDAAPADVAPAATKPAPPASKEWLTVTRTEWAAVWADKVTGAVYSPGTDLASIYRLFGMRDDRERYRRLVHHQPLVEGSQGQPVMNPLARLIASLDYRILALEDRFGLNPKARLQLGVTLGKAARSLDDLVGDPFGDEEEDPRTAPVDTRSRQT